MQRLYPLEVQDTKTVNRDVKAEEIDCKPPKRRAAVEADKKRKLIDKFSQNLSGECKELRATNNYVWRKSYHFQ